MNIDEIRERADAATPGPWHTEKVYHDEPGYEEFIKSARVSTKPDRNHSASTVTMNNWSNPAMADLEFIAHARTDIPWLLSEVDRLQSVLADLKDNGHCRSCAGCNAPHSHNLIMWCNDWEWRGNARKE